MVLMQLNLSSGSQLTRLPDNTCNHGLKTLTLTIVRCKAQAKYLCKNPPRKKDQLIPLK